MQQRGFTLIELVIVIVILGILAVTAAPRFVGFQTDARIATLEGVEGALVSASEAIHAKAIIAGATASSNTTINVNGTDINIRYGYPYSTYFDDNNNTTTVQLDSYMNLDIRAVNTTADQGTTDWYVSANGTWARIYPDGFENVNCYVEYRNAAAGGSPTITLTSTAC
ncbi:type II secretion system protein [Alteromonas lipotrueae]|uniref:type II secretion system protein n=1 Tax=Alteromonas lipotrueae TaxID=2803814 RepID=UPI001C454116|nr:type II secretion system protein [Alteromonas lipotrueae]